ncbi:DNA polymerase I A, chloroplastic-like isoform X1 [Iris pallida]|uniref:DNA polymerase I A, chloroplastic-like isoform X1 n=1 Tax=Iris pallida TaxID=29817 RepID=A0AAX6H0M0_IRIPA|nr:DNA polymerase I A, chloroplastic-like isoform X1 [Iris pallida]
MAMGVSTHTSPFTSSSSFPFRFSSSAARRSFSRPAHPACRRLSGSPSLGNYFRASSDCGGWGAESEKLKLAKMAHQVRDKVASRSVFLHDEFERSKIVTTVERLREGLASGQSQLTGAAERLQHLVPVGDNLANGWDPTAQREKSVCVAAFKEGSGYARRTSQIGGGTWDGTVARDHPAQAQTVTLEDIEKIYSGRVGTASNVFNGTDSTVSKSSINSEACNEVPREQNSPRQKLRTSINGEEWDEMSREQTSPRKKLSHNGGISSINGEECNKELMVSRDHPAQAQTVTLEDIEKIYSGRVGAASDVFNGTDGTVSKSSINRGACNEVPREQNSPRRKLRTLINGEEWDEMSREQTSPRKKLSHKGSISSINGEERNKELMEETSPQQNLSRIFDKVLVVDNISKAREVVQLLTTKYKDLVHACDTEASSQY